MVRRASEGNNHSSSTGPIQVAKLDWFGASVEKEVEDYVWCELMAFISRSFIEWNCGRFFFRELIFFLFWLLMTRWRVNGGWWRLRWHFGGLNSSTWASCRLMLVVVSSKASNNLFLIINNFFSKTLRNNRLKSDRKSIASDRSRAHRLETSWRYFFFFLNLNHPCNNRVS